MIGGTTISTQTVNHAPIQPPTSRLPTRKLHPVEPSLEMQLEQSIPVEQRQDDLGVNQRWRKPDLRRAYSAGQLLFQVVGVAGFAGYFVSMHTLMRVFSGILLAGTWYAIYKVKGTV